MNPAASSKLSDYPTHWREDEGLEMLKFTKSQKSCRRLYFRRNVIRLLGASNEKIRRVKTVELVEDSAVGRKREGAIPHQRQPGFFRAEVKQFRLVVQASTAADRLHLSGL